MKDRQKLARRSPAVDRKSVGFTAEERAAMKEHAGFCTVGERRTQLMNARAIFGISIVLSLLSSGLVAWL